MERASRCYKLQMQLRNIQQEMLCLNRISRNGCFCRLDLALNGGPGLLSTHVQNMAIEPSTNQPTAATTPEPAQRCAEHWQMN